MTSSLDEDQRRIVSGKTFSLHGFDEALESLVTRLWYTQPSTPTINMEW